MSKEYKLGIDVSASGSLEGSIKELERLVELKKEIGGKLQMVQDSDLKGLVDLLANTEKVTKAIESQKKVIEEKTAIEKERDKLEDKLKEARKDSIQQNEELKVLISEQNKINKQAAKESLGMVSAYDKLAKQLNENKKQVKGLLATGKQLSDVDKKLIKDTQDLDAKLKEIDKTVGDNQRNVGNYKDSIIAAAKETGIFGSSLGTVTNVFNQTTSVFNSFSSQLNQQVNIFKAAASATKETEEGTVRLSIAQRASAVASAAATSGLKLLRVALISTGIGALVLGIGSLIAFLTKTQRGIEFVERATAGLSAIFAKLTDFAIILGEKLFKAFQDPKQAIIDFGNFIITNITNRFIGLLELIPNLGKAITLAFKGQWSEAGKVALDAVGKVAIGVENLSDKIVQFGDAVSDAFNQVSEAAEKAISLKRQLQELDKAQARYAVTIARQNRDLKEAILLSRDEEASIYDRIKALKEVERAQEAQTEQLLKFARERLRIQKAQNALSESTEEDLQKERDLQIEIFNIEAELFERKRTTQKAILRLEKEQAAELKALRSAEAEFDKMQADERLKARQVRNKIEVIELENQILALGEKEIEKRKLLEEKLRQLKISQLQNEKELILNNTEITEDERFLLIAETENKILQLKKKSGDEQKKINKDVLDNTDKTINSIAQAQAKKHQENLKRIDQEIAAANKSADLQAKRAADGLDNTLEFEQEKLAKLEQERERAAKREARRLKVAAYYSLFAGYAKQDANTALQKTARDIALSEAATALFAQDGGIVGEVKDRVNMAGGRLSKTHGSGYDRLVVADKREGILTVSEMAALGGKEGFNRLRDSLKFGGADGLFEKVPVFTPVGGGNSEGKLIEEIRDLKNVVKNKKETAVNVDKYGDVIKTEVENGFRTTVKKIRSRPRI